MSITLENAKWLMDVLCVFGCVANWAIVEMMLESCLASANSTKVILRFGNDH